MDPSIVARAAPILGCSAVFVLSGIGFSATQLTCPILYRLPVAAATDFFQEFYYRGQRTVIPFAAFSTLSFAASAYYDSRKRSGYASAAALAFAWVPWTVLLLAKTNSKLLDLAADERLRVKVGPAAIVDLIKTWSSLNSVRAGFAFSGGLVGLLTLAGVI